jgi:hypothetical protein
LFELRSARNSRHVIGTGLRVRCFFELIKAKENPQEQGEKTCGLIFSDKEYFKCFTIEEKWALTVYRRTAALDYV